MYRAEDAKPSPGLGIPRIDVRVHDLTARRVGILRPNTEDVHERGTARAIYEVRQRRDGKVIVDFHAPHLRSPRPASISSRTFHFRPTGMMLFLSSSSGACNEMASVICRRCCASS